MEEFLSTQYQGKLTALEGCGTSERWQPSILSLFKAISGQAKTSSMLFI